MGKIRVITKETKDNDMTGIQGSDFYDRAFSKDKYSGDYKELSWYPVWKTAAEWVPENADILDLGCGLGFFAKTLLDNMSVNSYKGVDFSKVAIGRASKKIKDERFEFVEGNIYDITDFEEYDVIILTEVLEHLGDDFGILLRIPKGKLVLFSLPTFLGRSHIRKFTTRENIYKRYSDMLDIKQIEPIKRKSGKKSKLKWFVCKSYKR